MITNIKDWKGNKINENGQPAVNDHYFDTTSLYKYFKDALYSLKDYAPEEAAQILEASMLRDYNIIKK